MKKLTIEFENEVVREWFLGWFSNSGEQSFDEAVKEYSQKYESYAHIDYQNAFNSCDSSIVITHCKD